MDYDPTKHGARCDICPLQGKTPCPPEEQEGALLLAIAEAPGQVEIQAGRPLVGASGQEFTLALRECGIRRNRVSTSNALLCRSPYDLKRLMRGVKEPFVNPIEACRPRLLAEVERANALLIMGAVAWSALTQAPIVTEQAADVTNEDGEAEGKGTAGMMRSRGFPLTLYGKPALATVNAAFVLRMRRMTTIFRGDVAKAVRHACGQLTWTAPEMIFFPSPARLRWMLAEFDRQQLFVSFDVETRPRDGGTFDSATDVLRCIGIGTSRTLTCIPFESVERDERGRRREYYTPEEREEVDDILLDWFARPGVAGAHNRQYDLTVCEHHAWSRGRRWKLGRKVIDSILLHHVAWSELKHDLGFCVAQYTDAPKHKDVDHSQWKSDHDLHKYCMLDVGHTSYLAPTLLKDERVIGQSLAVRMDHVLSTVCQRMHEIGMAVDLGEQARHFRLLTHEMDEHRVKSRGLAIKALESEPGATRAQHKLAEEFNPGSMDQLRKLLFDVYGVIPVPEKAGGMTETGDPSVDKAALFYLIDKGLPPTLVDLLLAVIDYREAQKLRGTYCDVPPGIDGRVHPNWNPHVVVSGRLSCSHPNLQNLPGPMKTIYCAAPGHLFIQCDKSQLEARIAAWLSQTLWQIELHQKGGDLHMETARAILRIPEGVEVSKQQRRFGKTFRFAAQYLAGVKRIQQMLRNYRDLETRKRPYREYTLTEARANHALFWKKQEDLMEYHLRNREFFDAHGYLETAIHHRRRYFLDGTNAEDSKEDLANLPIQGCHPADVRVLTRDGMVEIGSAPETGVVWTGTKWAPYKKLYRGRWELAEIVLKNGQKLRCDTRHSVLVATDSAYTFRQWHDLKLGDRVCLSMARPMDFGRADVVDTETAYWLGYAIGNGCTPTALANSMIMSFGNRKERYTKEQKLAEWREYVSAAGFKQQKAHVQGECVTSAVCAADFRKWWEGSCGYVWHTKAHTKRVPSAVWRAGLSARRRFLIGLMDADGCVGLPTHDSNGCRCGLPPFLFMCNRALLAEVQILARSVGVSSVMHGPYKSGRMYRLDLNGAQLADMGYGYARLTRARVFDTAPTFLLKRFLSACGASPVAMSRADRAVVNFAQRTGKIGVYTLGAIAHEYGLDVGDVYATSSVVATKALGTVEDTFTLSVDDPGHRFDSEGVISKNTAADDVNEATERAVTAYPWGFAGPRTGLVNQTHDSLMFEVPQERALEIGLDIQRIMGSYLEGMPLPVDLAIGRSWGALKEVKNA